MSQMTTEQVRSCIQGETPVLLDFWAPWCVYCMRIAPAVEQVEAERGNTLVVGQVNVDEEGQLAGELGIEAIPTFVLFRKGQLLDTLLAPGSKEEIDAFLAAHLSGQ